MIRGPSARLRLSADGWSLLRRLLALSFVGLLVLGSASAAAAQGEASRPRLTPNDFISLSGAGFAVRYTPGGLDRAHHLLRRLEVLNESFTGWSEVPAPTVVYVMNRDEWGMARLTDVYGVPLRIGPVSVAMPATGDRATVEFWKQRFHAEALPLNPGVPMVGTSEEAATMAIADVLLQIEASRGFAQRAGLYGRQAWIGETLSHVSARLVFERHESDRVPRIAEAFARLGLGLGGAGAHPLSSYQSLPDVGPEGLDRWLWFQAQFHAAAGIIVDRTGKKTIKKLIKLSDSSGGLLPEQGLLELYPGLRSWLEASFAH